MRAERFFSSLLLTVMACLLPAAAIGYDVQDTGARVIIAGGVVAGPEVNELHNVLAEIERETGVEVRVLAVRSLDGEDIESFGLRHANDWDIGDARSDEGVLIVLSDEDRSVHIFTGDGSRDDLPDTWCTSTSEKAAQRYFKNREFGAGLTFMAEAVRDKLLGQGGGFSLGQYLPAFLLPHDMGSTIKFVFFILLALAALLILYNSLKPKRDEDAWKDRENQGLFDRMLENYLLRHVNYRKSFLGDYHHHRGSSFGGGGGGFGGGGGASFGGGGGGAGW